VNTGYANAGTGNQGMKDALACCETLASVAGCASHEVLPFSTGVIGEPLPVETIQAGIPAAFSTLSPSGWEDAAHGIMTTDTVPKAASCRVEIAGHTVTVSGIAKGAGMIRPDMATMLAFIATDAAIDKRLLQICLRTAVERSFNRITVDGDTSTNDACLLMATGQSSLPEISCEDENYPALSAAITDVCEQLATAIVRDGEGASKFVTVDVQGGESRDACLQVAYAIAHSPLVKTALFASDPNWGRILAAVGRAGLADLDLQKVDIYLDDVCIVSQGARAESYREAEGQRVMDQPDLTIRVVLGRGEYTERVWTCDLSYEYVRINAEYRT
jgi:glutamate N-acetyltransferase/amino-acid N-acetyltransferase